MAAVFNFDADPMPRCPGLAEPLAAPSPEAPSGLEVQLARFALPEEAQYVHAVKSIQDLAYFEDKTQKLDLACARWLSILSTAWSAAGIGPQLAAALQADNTGTDAIFILMSCFGGEESVNVAEALQKVYELV